jgi:hypothetical protein
MNRQGQRYRLRAFLELAGDEDQLGNVEPLDPVHHPVHDRPAGDLEDRLRDEMGVGAEAGALPGQRNDHLHGQFLP